MREIGMAIEQNVDTTSAESDFPVMTASASADKSFAPELARVQNLSIEARVVEALTMKNRFGWLHPVVGDPES